MSPIHAIRKEIGRLYHTRNKRHEEIPKGSGQVIKCLTIEMLGNSDAIGGSEQSKDGT